MENSISPVDAYKYLSAAQPLAGGSTGKVSGSDQFVELFLSQVMKDAFNSDTEDSFYGNEGFGSDYKDMMIRQVVSQLAESDAFGLKNIVENKNKEKGVNP